MPANTCHTCGGPAGITLTEVTAPRGAVVTRHYCAAHLPPEDPAVARAIADALAYRAHTRAKLRRLIARTDELLDRLYRKYPKRRREDAD